MLRSCTSRVTNVTNCRRGQWQYFLSGREVGASLTSLPDVPQKKKNFIFRLCWGYFWWHRGWWGAVGLGSPWVKSCYAFHKLCDVGKQLDLSEPLRCWRLGRTTPPSPGCGDSRTGLWRWNCLPGTEVGAEWLLKSWMRVTRRTTERFPRRHSVPVPVWRTAWEFHLLIFCQVYVC